MIGRRIDGELVRIAPGQALCGIGFDRITLEIGDFEDLANMRKTHGDKIVMDWLTEDLQYRMCPIKESPPTVKIRS